ncbi:MAG: DUF2748 family protein [Rickettsiaceae bacterium]|nr:DUF2748 family protein [Rickettsiaceae bacterium]
MSSVYHILNKAPAIYEIWMPKEYEILARELVNSGRLRIDTNYYSNFVRYTDHKYKINVTFSYQELVEANLIPHTRAILKKIYKNKEQPISDKKIEEIIQNLKNNTKKLLLPNPELTMMLARILVQSAHPIVIRWLLIDRVEIFITYSHNIGDTMSISDWKHNGANSGMQSTNGLEAIIYVSCGGDPFAKNLEEYPQFGDGWAALARMQIIAAQEIGHYADIMRNEKGQQITRHSANFSCTMPKPNVAQARLDDIKHCKNLIRDLLKNGLKNLIDTERKLKFYDQQKLNNLIVWFLKIKAYFQKKSLLKYSKNNHLIFPQVFYRKEKYMGLQMQVMIEDMLSNLTPGADVYKNPNPQIEEAIACAESLARVPQQAVKWGHITTSLTMRNLYKVYYEQVIPSLIDNYQKYTGINFVRNQQLMIEEKNYMLKLLYKLYFFFKKDKIKFVETRIIL